MRLTLNIFLKTEEDLESEALGLGGPEKTLNEDQVTIEITFFQINYMQPYQDKYCLVSSGSEEFISKESYEEVLSLITLNELYTRN